MARNDMRFSRCPNGGSKLAAFVLDAGQTFENGEPVVVGATGELAECGDDPATVSGIAAASSQGKDADGVNGTRPTGTPIQLYVATDDQIFETDNFATDGAGTAAVPTLANVGDTAGFTLSSGVWSVDTGTANTHVEIVEVLDVRGNILGDSQTNQGAGVTVRFVFI